MKNISLKKLYIITSILFFVLVILTIINVKNKKNGIEIIEKKVRYKNYLKIISDVSNILNEIINDNNENDSLKKDKLKHFFKTNAIVIIKKGKRLSDVKKINEYLTNISINKKTIKEIIVEEILLNKDSLINKVSLSETWKN